MTAPGHGGMAADAEKRVPDQCGRLLYIVAGCFTTGICTRGLPVREAADRASVIGLPDHGELLAVDFSGARLEQAVLEVALAVDAVNLELAVALAEHLEVVVA